MSKASSLVSSFCWKGRLIEINRQKKQIKYIKLATDKGDCWIKISKKLRANISGIPSGSHLEVKGKLKQKCKQAGVKYKAQVITIIPQDKTKESHLQKKAISLLPIVDTPTKSKAKILVCQKSNCWKKGGQKVYQALESVLSDRNLTKEIPIKKTGCLKKCKHAPNLLMLPDKAQYTKVKPKHVEGYIQQHLIMET